MEIPPFDSKDEIDRFADQAEDLSTRMIEIIYQLVLHRDDIQWHRIHAHPGFVSPFEWDKLEEGRRLSAGTTAEKEFATFRNRKQPHPSVVSVDQLSALEGCTWRIFMDLTELNVCVELLKRLIRKRRELFRENGAVGFPEIAPSYVESLCALAERMIDPLFGYAFWWADGESVTDEDTKLFQQIHIAGSKERYRQIVLAKETTKQFVSDTERRCNWIRDMLSWYRGDLLSLPCTVNPDQFRQAMTATIQVEIARAVNRAIYGTSVSITTQFNIELLEWKKPPAERSEKLRRIAIPQRIRPKVGDEPVISNGKANHESSNGFDLKRQINDNHKKTRKKIPRNPDTAEAIRFLNEHGHQFSTRIDCVKEFCRKFGVTKDPKILNRELSRFSWMIDETLFRGQIDDSSMTDG